MNKLFLFIILAFLAIGCKKTERVEEVPQHEYIDSMLTIENEDTLATSFEYNNLNKLSKIKASDSAYTKLEYYPSGELAIADSYFFPAAGEAWRSYIVYTYDDADTLESAVVKLYYNDILQHKTTLSYVLNNFDQVEKIISSDVHVIPHEFITYDEDGNIATLQTFGNVASTKTFAYSDKKSYLSNVGFKYYVGSTGMHRGVPDVVPIGIPVDAYNKNFKTRYTNTFIGVDEEDIDIEFNSTGFPTRSAVKKAHTGGSAKRVFVYKLR